MSMLRAGVVVGCLVMLVGCGGGGSGPSIQPLDNQVASVGVELTIQVRAVDDDGDSLRFDFVAPGIPDLKTRPSKATITSFADGVANFRWTPIAADRSDTPYSFDFIVSDGSHTSTETIEITYKDGVALGESAVGQLESGHYVPNCVNARDAGVQSFIGDDESTIHGDASLLVAQALGARSAADCNE